ncbi:MAG: glycosyltransferase family 2 protein [Dehalococcoidia bacterium]
MAVESPQAAAPAEAASSRPMVSVIVLGWNGRQDLEGCLSSLLDQTLPRDQYDVLYVDNGSRDGSLEFVRDRFPDVRVLALDRNYGYCEGNNIGFGETRGQFAVFLNQDAVLHRACLQELVNAVRSSPEIVAAHANIIQPWYPEFAGIDERAGVDAGFTAEVTRLGYMRYRRLRSMQPVDTIFIHTVCAIVRRDAVDELEYVFDPDFFAYAEDLDLGLRIRALGYRSVVVPKAIVYHKHTLKTDMSWSTVVKTVRIIRNRYLAFYKVMSGWEFALMAVLLTVGAPFNALEFGLKPSRTILYGLALVPATLIALVVTLGHLPQYAAKRRRIRERAARRGAWCLRALWTGAGV